MLGLDIRGLSGTVARHSGDNGWSAAQLMLRRSSSRSPAYGPSVCGGGFKPQVPVSFTPPPFGRGYATAQPQGVAGLGSLFCGSLDHVDDQLKIALAEAERVGVTSGVVYATAKSFYARTAGFFGEAPVLPSTCAAVSQEGLDALSKLNAQIASAGGRPVDQPPASTDPVDTLKTVVIWGAAGLALIYLGPALFSALKGAVR